MSNVTVLFLLFNAAIVGALSYLAFRFLQRRGESFFRDDLWEAKQRRQEEGRINDDIDRIALTGPSAEVEDEPTEKIIRGAKTNQAAGKTDPMIQNPSSPYRAPKFSGLAHEILGIDAKAEIATIQAAYKHWIKRYHPDRVQHLGPGYIRQATLRSELLNRAKAEMIEKIK